MALSRDVSETSSCHATDDVVASVCDDETTGRVQNPSCWCYHCPMNYHELESKGDSASSIAPLLHDKFWCILSMRVHINTGRELTNTTHLQIFSHLFCNKESSPRISVSIALYFSSLFI